MTDAPSPADAARVPAAPTPARRGDAARKLREAARCNVVAACPSLLAVTGCAPLYANLRLTGRCGARCRTCRHWSATADGELSTAAWTRVIDDLRRGGIIGASFTGGDVLLRSDALALMRHAVGRGMDVHATMNGYALTEPIARELGEIGLRSLSLSLDDLGGGYDALRGVPSASAKVVGALELLRRHHDGRTQLGVAVTLMRQTLATALDVMRWALDHDLAVQVNAIHFTHYFSDTPFARAQHRLDPGERRALGAALEWLLAARRARPRLLPKATHLEWLDGYFDDHRQRATPCFKPMLKLCVEPNGDVRPCCSLPTVGSLVREELAAIVRSPRYLAVARAGVEKTCPGCSCHYPLSVDANALRRGRELLLRTGVARARLNGGGAEATGRSAAMLRQHTRVAGRVAYHGLAAARGVVRVGPLLRARTRPTVVFETYSVHLAQFYAPVVRALRERVDAELRFLAVPHPHFPLAATGRLLAYAQDALGFPAASVRRLDQAIWERADVVVCVDLFAWFPPRRGRSVLMLHGPGLAERAFRASPFKRRLDEFDRVLVPGEYDRRLIGAMAASRALAERVVVTGCPFLGELERAGGSRAEYCRRLGLDPARPIALIAPSWQGLRLAGRRGETYLDDLVRALAPGAAQLVVKLHACSLNPMMAGGTDWRRKASELAARERVVRIDWEVDDRPALKHAAVLVTDISSRAFACMRRGVPVIQYFPSAAELEPCDAQRLALLREGALVALTPDAVAATLGRVLDERLRNPAADAVGATLIAHTAGAAERIADEIRALAAPPPTRAIAARARPARDGARAPRS